MPSSPGGDLIATSKPFGSSYVFTIISTREAAPDLLDLVRRMAEVDLSTVHGPIATMVKLHLTQELARTTLELLAVRA